MLAFTCIQPPPFECELHADVLNCFPTNAIVRRFDNNSSLPGGLVPVMVSDHQEG
jgi:hypothetical protein